MKKIEPSLLYYLRSLAMRAGYKDPVKIIETHERRRIIKRVR